MFDLEKTITAWREQMLTAGIKSPLPLQELEIHLREEIERQVKSGVNSRRAFEIATAKVGPPLELKTEFNKIAEPLEMRLVKLVGIACGVVGSLFLLWTVYVSLFIREANWGSRTFGLLALAATILSWRHSGRFLPAIRCPEVRAAAGLVSCGAGVGGTLLFIGQGLPGLYDFSAGVEFSLNRLLVSFVIAWTAMAILECSPTDSKKPPVKKKVYMFNLEQAVANGGGMLASASKHPCRWRNCEVTCAMKSNTR